MLSSSFLWGEQYRRSEKEALWEEHVASYAEWRWTSIGPRGTHGTAGLNICLHLHNQTRSTQCCESWQTWYHLEWCSWNSLVSDSGALCVWNLEIKKLWLREYLYRWFFWTIFLSFKLPLRNSHPSTSLWCGSDIDLNNNEINHSGVPC